eukprot:9926546-Prorocentrum_lima.AAC.1
MTLGQVRAHMRNVLPQYLHTAWDRVNLPSGSRCADSLVAPLTDWILSHGPEHGVRFPTTAERAAALGL